MGPCPSRRVSSVGIQTQLAVDTPVSQLPRLRKAVRDICRLLRKRQWWSIAGQDTEVPKKLWNLVGRQLKPRAELFRHVERVAGKLRYKR